MKHFGIVYSYVHEISGTRYIGSTTLTLGRRWSRQVIKAINGAKSPLCSAIREYGKETFSKEVLSYGENREELDRLESAAIGVYGTIHPAGYNVQSGGYKTFKHHQISKDRFSVTSTGRKWSDESKAKMSLSMLGKNVGKVRSLEGKEAVSITHKGKPKSPAQRLKMSLAASNLSPEVRARRGEAIRAAFARKKLLY